MAPWEQRREPPDRQGLLRKMTAVGAGSRRRLSSGRTRKSVSRPGYTTSRYFVPIFLELLNVILICFQKMGSLVPGSHLSALRVNMVTMRLQYRVRIGHNTICLTGYGLAVSLYC
jgi:hypothetical protein